MSLSFNFTGCLLFFSCICPQCGAAFTSMGILKDHVKWKHSNNCFKCEFCSYSTKVTSYRMGFTKQKLVVQLRDSQSIMLLLLFLSSCAVSPNSILCLSKSSTCLKFGISTCSQNDVDQAFFNFFLFVLHVFFGQASWQRSGCAQSGLQCSQHLAPFAVL